MAAKHVSEDRSAGDRVAIVFAMSLGARLRAAREYGVVPSVLGKALFWGEQWRQPTGPRAVAVRLNQSLFEAGNSAPWVWSAERCRRYWATRTSDGADNRPVDYSGKSPAIVDFLHEFWHPDVGPDDRILEIGPNAGANLARLGELGYGSLAGAEINPEAVEEMRRAFPKLADSAQIVVGPVEETLPAMPDDSADTVFAMAVLLHIHPTSDAVFDHMARIARRHVCVIEAEHVTLGYIFARNYQRVFERRGCRQVRELELTAESAPSVGPDYYGYTARLFAVPSYVEA
jgi:SAM-dependent methyltransferase